MPKRGLAKQRSTSSLPETIPQLLTETQAAEYLGVSTSALQKGRMEGNPTGNRLNMPPHVKIPGVGVRYRKIDCDEWLANLQPQRVA